MRFSYRIEGLLSSLALLLLNNSSFYNSLDYVLGVRIGETPESIGKLKLLLIDSLIYIINFLSLIGGILVIFFSILIIKDLIMLKLKGKE